jgi:hypothetical protein
MWAASEWEPEGRSSPRRTACRTAAAPSPAVAWGKAGAREREREREERARETAPAACAFPFGTYWTGLMRDRTSAATTRTTMIGTLTLRGGSSATCLRSATSRPRGEIGCLPRPPRLPARPCCPTTLHSQRGRTYWAFCLSPSWRGRVQRAMRSAQRTTAWAGADLALSLVEVEVEVEASGTTPSSEPSQTLCRRGRARPSCQQSSRPSSSSGRTRRPARPRTRCRAAALPVPAASDSVGLELGLARARGVLMTTTTSWQRSTRWGHACSRA